MNKIVLFDIDYTLFDTDFFKSSDLKDFRVYQEVTETLKTLEKIAKLGIFSEGNLNLQHLKLHNTNILSHFIANHVHITVNKEEDLEKILQKYRNDNVFLIDDKLSILYKAKSVLHNLHTIWIKRGIYALSQDSIKGYKPDSTVSNLGEVVEIIKNT